jgi:hypothetical protein
MYVHIGQNHKTVILYVRSKLFENVGSSNIGRPTINPKPELITLRLIKGNICYHSAQNHLTSCLLPKKMLLFYMRVKHVLSF